MKAAPNSTAPGGMLIRIDRKMQARLTFLMGKNNEGQLTESEMRELVELGDHAEKLSLQNAQILADSTDASPRRRHTVRLRFWGPSEHSVESGQQKDTV